MKSFSALSFISVATLAALPSVLAHGRVDSITIGGTLFKGPAANDFNTESTIRTINSIEPVKDVKGDDMECGAGAAKVTAKRTAPAKAGDEVLFDWVNGNGVKPWPHTFGPMLTYLANCGDDCSKFSSADAQWFKIDEAGFDTKSGQWVQAETLAQGKPYAMKLPADLPNGNYLMRHEVIGLHNAGSVDGAEYYPACMQIAVTGGPSAAAKLPAKDFVQFPGAYSDQDAGLHIDVFSPPFKGNEASYPFPGPEVVSFASSGGNKGGDNTTDNGNTNDDSGSPAASSSSALPKATASVTKSASPSSITPAPTPTDAGSGDDNSSGDEVVETVTVTVTVKPKRVVKTVTAFVTATVDAVQAQAATSTASAAPTGYLGEGGYHRRSRIMGRRHY